MQPRADGDPPVRVEADGQVLRREDVGVGHDQGERPHVRLGLPAPRDLPPVGAFCPIDDLREQLDLVPAADLDPPLGDPGHPGGQAGNAQDVRRAAFEEVRHEVRLDLALGVAPGAPLAPGPRPRPRPHIQRARARRPEECLVAGESEEVDRRRPQVNRHHPRRLRGIDEEKGSSLPDDRRDPLDRLHGPQHVGGVGQGDQARLGRERLADRVRVDVAAIGSDPRERDDPGLRQRHQWTTYGVMLQVRRDDVVARLDRALDRDVQGVGAIQGEDPAFGVLAVEEPVERVPRLVERPLRLGRHPVPRAAGVGQLGAGELVEREVDRLGLREAGGRVVEVDHVEFPGGELTTESRRTRRRNSR